MSLSWLLLVSSAAAAAVEGCRTDDDCLLNGACTNAHCVCSPGWMGDTCSELIRSPTAKPIHVGCVGDSITAGYLASPSSMAYPAQLQTQLTARFGTGSYEVSNFGAGGAAVQRAADSPYWNRTQFAAWVNGTYDIIVIMLGTNDAKVSTAECVARWGPTSHMCAANWPKACSGASPTSENCPVIRDYLAIIALARTLGTGGRAPLVTVMTPPPLWKDGAYGMSNAVLNDAMPKLVPHIAKLAGLPRPIDLYTAMGGVADWRSTFPVCGCQRPPAAAVAVTRPDPGGGAAAGNYTATHGYMSIGEVITTESLSWRAAAAACSGDADCAGFTFKSNASQPTAQVTVRLKQCAGVTPNSRIGWWSWTKPPGAVPASKMPASCALFCRVGQSCDPCHPDNDGYTLLATKVFHWIVAATGTAVPA